MITYFSGTVDKDLAANAVIKFSKVQRLICLKIKGAIRTIPTAGC